jgi:hypothetical protein
MNMHEGVAVVAVADQSRSHGSVVMSVVHWLARLPLKSSGEHSLFEVCAHVWLFK